MQDFLRPGIVLVLFAVLLIITSFFFNSDAIDIHVHDAYFVIAYAHLFWLVSAFWFVLALIYWLTSGFLLSYQLTWIHVILTLLLFMVFFIFTLSVKQNAPPYLDLSIWPGFNRSHNRILSWLVLLLFFTQLLFIVNIAGGIIRRFTSH